MENPDGSAVLVPIDSERMYMYIFICGTGYSGNTPHAWDAKAVCLIECISYLKVEFSFSTYFGLYLKRGLNEFTFAQEYGMMQL